MGAQEGGIDPWTDETSDSSAVASSLDEELADALQHRASPVVAPPAPVPEQLPTEEVDPPPPPPPPSDPELERPLKRRAGVHDKQGRMMPWSRWSLSAVCPGPTYAKVGWGANCLRHSNVDDGPNTRCQTSMRFGGRAGYTEEDCRRMMKKWLLLGNDIPEDDPNGRREHMALRSGLLCHETEEELDAMGAALV